ncbi:MAG: tetratricopeptide repeat protein [candidate division Zixibacteria bacterium]|nr:tetratricopeptide repeat protein [candidate division Zixibacteria bacterium]
MRLFVSIGTIVLAIAAIFIAPADAIDRISKPNKATMIDPQAEITADSLLKLADSTFQKRDYATALEQYDSAAALARKEFNPSIETEALSQMARMYIGLNRIEEGRPILEKAKIRANQSDQMGWSRYLSVRGRFEWKEDSLPKSRETFMELHEYCRTNNLWARAVDAANMLAIVCEKPEERIDWSRQGIAAAEEGEVPSWLGPLWNNLGATFYEMKAYDSALAAYITSREYHWRHSAERSKLFADYHIGMTYRHLGEYDEAAKWIRPMLAWAERLEDHDAIAQALEEMGEIEIGLGKTKQGVETLKQALKEYRIAGNDKSRPDIFNALVERVKTLE